MTESRTPVQEVDSAFDDNSGYANSGTYDIQEQELLKEIIEVQKSLDIFEHRVLRGEMEIIDKKTSAKKWITLAGPLVNELGVREIMAIMTSRITKNAKLTYKTTEEIYRDMFYANMSLAETFAKRAPSWELNIENAKSLMDSCIQMIWDTISMSAEGFLSINLRSSYTKSDVSRTEPPQAKSGGFLSNLFGGHR